MSRFGPSIEIAPKIQRPLPDKQILWGSQDGGCNRFPTIDAIWERKYAMNPMPLTAFGQAVSEALDRVWIMDEYLLIPDNGKGNPSSRIEQILSWMPIYLCANDIRLLTKHHTEVHEGILAPFDARVQEINKRSPRRAGQCRIELKYHLTQPACNFVHDRFAIIDDDLWHFGGTVGGFHASVSAASRGWRASEHGAVEFFELIWNAGVKK
jgi:hypothetical protein